MSDTIEDLSEPKEQRIARSQNQTPSFLIGFGDVWNGARKFDLWFNLALEDIRQSYAGTKLGLLWAPLAFILRLVVFVFLFGGLIVGSSSSEASNVGLIICYISIGFYIWEVISSSLTNGSILFKSNANWIKSTSLPVSLFAFQNTGGLLFRMALNTIPLAVAVYIFRQGLHPNTNWLDFVASTIGLTSVVVNTVWVQVFLGLVCARFKDLQHLIQSAILFLFFLTPIFWRPHFLGGHGEDLYAINPFTHFIEVVRTPLLEHSIPYNSWMIVLGITIIGNLFTWVLLGLCKKRLAYWI